MDYVLLIYEDESIYDGGETSQVWKDVLAAHDAFAGELAQKGLLKGGAGLKTSPTATTVRRDGDRSSLHDGPFAESKEQLGGFYIIDVPDLDAALDWARRIPLAAGGSVEVRPALDT